MVGKYAKSVLVLAIFTFLVISLLVFLAYQTAWRYHLEVDIWGFYYPRFVYFLNNFSFTGFGKNEYFPGAMFFFLIPGLSAFWGNTWEVYLIGLFIVNIALIMLHIYIYRRNNFIAPFIFLAILLLSGPIILYRHELFISLFVILSFLAWKAERKYLSAFILGLGSSIKIYPLLIFPYFLMLMIKKRKMNEVFRVILFFSFGILSVFGLFVALGATPAEILIPMQVNSIKPVHIESLWGTFLTIVNYLIDGSWLIGKGDHGVFGINPQDIFLPLIFFNYFWLFPLLVFYLFLYKTKAVFSVVKIEIIFLILLLFIIFSKIITPQYIFWFILLFPLFSWTGKRKLILTTSLAIILIIGFLTQYIYPLQYSELLGIFYAYGEKVHLFYLLLARNLLLVVLFTVIFYLIFFKFSLTKK